MTQTSLIPWRQEEMRRIDRLYPLEMFRAEERTIIVEEYLSNKKQAAEFKRRGQSHVLGNKFERKIHEKAAIETAKGTTQMTTKDNARADMWNEQKCQRNVPVVTYTTEKLTEKAKLVDAISKLNKKDIQELKCLKNPPALVKMVVEAVLVILGIKPQRKYNSGTIVNDYWGPGTEFLGNTKCLQILQTIDKDNIPAENMAKIRTDYINNPDFNPENLKTKSRACEGLCKWVLALEAYDRTKAQSKNSAVTSSEKLKTTTKDKVEPWVEKRVQTNVHVVASKTAKETENDVFQSGNTAVCKLEKADIVILRSLATPPNGVKMVIEAMLIILGIQPKRKPDKSGKMVDDYWNAGKKFLANPKCHQILMTLDKDNIPAEAMENIRTQYIKNPEFNPEIIQKASKACAGLCQWVIDLEAYDRMLRKQ